MKKILISAKNLRIGGIEKSLIEFINYLLGHGYIVTLALEEKNGELLKKIDSNVKIIEYMPCSLKFILLRKFINLIKEIQFSIKYKNKFDISISYATYSSTSSFIARISSKKSILWCHADYLALLKKEEKVRKFFKQIKYNKFKKIVFVSKSARKTFLGIFPEQKNTYFCNNLINSKDIIEKSNEKIEISYDNSKITFLNVGRHDEAQKRLTRIIEAAKILKQEKYKFRIIFIGEGKDTKLYKDLVNKYKLEKEICFLGVKENPYPYFKISDAVILSSEYEGYPVVFLESYILNKPIITTKVSDYDDIQNGSGIVAEKCEKGIYLAMKEFLNNRYTENKIFDAYKYNSDIEQKLIGILEKF